MSKWANMSTYEGMPEDERNIYEIARYVRMPGEKVEPFIKVLAMCGYQITRRENDGREAGGAKTGAAISHQAADPV